ncbi:MFS transporter [Vreelandella lutescens]|uniref:MFS-type transporter n=1 Tax=Vreelandella lutescens TaxID=1602943 RepID=A0ABQ1PN49_9GAMM|nr:MFS transporter [Halomonas lutescens]GGD00088.1 putative MFS-type transporter [Halomonas lutescens]
MQKDITVQSRRGLDWMNFFLADVRDGVGPYLAIFLLASQNWSSSDIGLVMGAMGVATGLAQIPAGKWMDSVRNKRLLLSGACGVVAIACPLMALYPVMWVVLPAQIAIGAAAAFILPGIASLTLGLVGHRQLAGHTGRNEVFNHAGNIVAALLAGAVGYFIANEYIFWVVSLWSLFSIVSVMTIRPSEVDDAQARGAERGSAGEIHIAKFLPLLKNRNILIFATVVMLFHFGNAAMLPLVGQQLSTQANGEGASLWMSACIILAQLVMIPIAKFAGKYVDIWGTRPVFMIALVALPIRGVLYTLSDAPMYLLAVQMLDGVGAGIFGVIWVLVVADLTKGSGHYSLTLGLMNVAHMVGFFLSQTTAGRVVDTAGSFSAGFLYLAAVAGLALLLFAVAMPETRTLGLGGRLKGKSDTALT